MTTASRPIQPALDGSMPPPPRPRSADYDEWIGAVRPVFEEVAATGKTFTTFEIADASRLPEPPDPAHHWGRLMTLLREKGIVRRAGWATSDRPTTHASGVRMWTGTRTHQRAWRAQQAAAEGRDAA